MRQYNKTYIDDSFAVDKERGKTDKRTSHGFAEEHFR